MTSEHTKEPTEAFFKRNNYFGLKKENVVMFEQNMLPCISFEGKIILDQKYKISRAPGMLGVLICRVCCHRNNLLLLCTKIGVSIHLVGDRRRLIRSVHLPTSRHCKRGRASGKSSLDLYRANIQSPVFQQRRNNFSCNFQIQSTAM